MQRNLARDQLQAKQGQIDAPMVVKAFFGRDFRRFDGCCCVAAASGFGVQWVRRLNASIVFYSMPPT
jgi:hypothetical protein